MYTKQILLGLAASITLMNCASAAQANASIPLKNTSSLLQDERMQVVKQYIIDLQKADYKDITRLFEKNGIVVSTSRGKVNAKDFFYAFLPNIQLASTQLNQTFMSDSDGNRMAARFHFIFKLKDGEEGSGEYVDEFVFSNNSSKLSSVYMFENLKFKNEMNIEN